MTDQPNADALVTEPVTSDAPPPFTAANSDPAAKLHPDKAGKRVSSPHVAADAKPKRKRKLAAAVKRLKRARAAVAQDDKILAADSKVIAGLDHSDAVHAEGVAARDAALAHQVESFADLPEDAALMLRLSDGKAFLDGTISVAPGEIVPAANGRTYTKDVEIGPDCPPVLVSEVWLVSLTGEAVCCEVGPLPGGNGHHAKIPAGHLKF